ncbi:MAG TPA: YueI family protein [Bacillota bacterium]|nr:YueI family protein [Bacillota bacterium]
MGHKDVEDYLNDGIHGVKLPKDDERKQYLGTLRERIVLALTIGQVMTDSGIQTLEEQMKKHPSSKLLINGKVAYRFLAEEIKVANTHNIPYTIVADEENDTDVGAVLTKDYAVNQKEIYLVKDRTHEQEYVEQNEKKSLLTAIKQFFSPNK